MPAVRPLERPAPIQPANEFKSSEKGKKETEKSLGKRPRQRSYRSTLYRLFHGKRSGKGPEDQMQAMAHLVPESASQAPAVDSNALLTQGSHLDKQKAAVRQVDSSVNLSTHEASPTTNNPTEGHPDKSSRSVDQKSTSADIAPVSVTLDQAVANSSGPDSQPVASTRTEEMTDAIKAERAKLAEGEGIAIGGQSFKLPEAADQNTARKVFANGIGALIDSNVDALLIRYAIAQAQLAGISGDQLRIDLDRQLTEEKPIPPGPDGAPRIFRVPKDNYIRELGLPERKIDQKDVTDVTPDDMSRAEQTKKDLLVDVIKAGKHIGLPERDITEAAEKLVNEKLQPKTTRKKDVQKAQELKEALMKANTETLTVIIAHPEILSDAHKQEVASLIRDKMKYVEKHWWRLNRKRKDEVITNEQIKAFMATPEQLNALEEKYKKAEPNLLTLLKLVFGLAVTTFFDLATDELEDNVMGQKYLR